MLHVYLSLLVGLLGSESWLARETAQSHLEAMLPLSEPLICLARARSGDIEIRVRSEEVWTTRCRLLAARIEASDGGPLPWIDQLPSSYPDRSEAIRWYRHVGAGGNIGSRPDWEGDRKATRAFLADFLRRHSFAQAQKMVDQMAINETAWRAAHTHPPRVPARWWFGLGGVWKVGD